MEMEMGNVALFSTSKSIGKLNFVGITQSTVEI